jgi:adenosylcobyric acid synthase
MGREEMKSLMIQGTGSYVGKSLIVAGLCRIFKKDGFNVVPFKAQNMSLNSFVTREGGEMGRAQVVQAEAAGIEPHVDMNPILIKPNTDIGAQIIIHGKVYRNMSATQYHQYKKRALRAVKESFYRLKERYELMVIEGAGSPAEINLRKNDIVNMGMAEIADCPVILVGDIDKGGVFASLIGTLELLSKEEKKRIKGFIINKFRGDIRLLEPGLDFLEKKTGLPVIGVIPYFKDLYLQEEDGVSVEKVGLSPKKGDIKIAVLFLPHISNFTDFDALEKEPEVEFRYIRPGSPIPASDLIIIPGSKNTIADLAYLRKSKYDKAILEHRQRGGFVIGICGGYQMLGQLISDPFKVETNRKSIAGLGLLDVETTIEKGKVTSQVKAKLFQKDLLPWKTGKIIGYEIHMGRTNRKNNTSPVLTIVKKENENVWIEDGAISKDGKVWGTYIHGIFDNDEFRRGFINYLRKRKGLCPLSRTDILYYHQMKREGFDNLERGLRENLDMDLIYQVLNLIPQKPRALKKTKRSFD